LAAGEFDAKENDKPSAVMLILPVVGALVLFTELRTNLL
jgi:hypothetical protein